MSDPVGIQCMCVSWLIAFPLPQAYATCLLRELLQHPIAAADQKRQSKKALATHWKK